MSFLQGTKSCAGAETKARSTRAGLLGSACAAATNLVLATGASASDWSSTFWGGPFPFATSITVLDATVAGTTTVNVDSTVAAAITTNNYYVGNSIFNVKAAGTVNSLIWGIWGQSASTQTATIDGLVDVSGNGVTLNTQLGTVGDITVSGAGTVTAGGYGLWLLGDKGTITVTGFKGGITGPANGIYAATTTGDQTYTIAGPIKSSLNAGIAAGSTTGDITANGSGTSVITAGIDGVDLVTSSGALTTDNFASITGGRAAIWQINGTGNNNIQGNGALTGNGTWGVLSTSAGGNINIGDVKTNGAITGATTGLEADTAGAGTVTIVQNANVTGKTVNGIYTSAATGATSITATAANVGNGGWGIAATSTTGSILIDGKGTGTAKGGVLDGVGVTTPGGNTTVENLATVGGFRNGIYVFGSAGTTSVQGNGLIGGVTASTLNGIVVGPSSGDVNIGTVASNGVITAPANGIWINNSSAGNNTVVQNNNVTGGDAFSGIVTGTATGATSITATADTKSGAGIWAVSTTGNILSDGKGTGVVTGTVTDGILYGTLSGNQTVQNFATVTGNLDGMWLVGSSGKTSVQGNGLVGGVTGTNRDGIVVGPSTGDVNIGTVATNGVITGNRNGIWVNNLAGGNTNIVVDKSVTGKTLNGIIATSVAGDTSIDIAAGATVQGLLDGVATGTITGTSTTTNAGIIKNINDTGAADTAGALAYWALAGTDVLNNTGTVIGGINTAGLGTTVNNDTGGVWIPSLVNAAAAPTDINNAGTINVRTGNTIGLQATTTLTNKAGGVIDMGYGGSGAAVNAKDTLNVLNFAPLGGSKIKMDVDFTQGNNSGTEGVIDDHSSNGKGTADTILVWYGLGGKAKPLASSTVDLKLVGTAATGTSGSVALVNAVAGGLPDPGPGGFATIVASTKYKLASDPSTGAVVYRLVEDKNGGVYLQWAPNVSAASLGGFGGAAGAGSGTSGTGAGSAPAGPGSGGALPPGGTSGTGGSGSSGGGVATGAAIAAAAGGLNGIGGFGGSGGPTGGGAAGYIADLSAAGVMLGGVDLDGNTLSGADYGADNRGGSLKDGGGYQTSACGGNGRGAWGQGEVTRSDYSGNGNGRSENLAGGLEANFGADSDRGCHRVAVGVFGFSGWSDTSWSSGSVSTETSGVGGYIRAASAIGLYGSLLGAYGWSDHDLTNNIYGSTAKKDGSNAAGVATLGYVARVAANAAVDLRTYVAYGNASGDAFTDSKGISISGTNDDLVTVGTSVGLHVVLAPGAQGFVRGGVKWNEVDSSITAFGITQEGSVDEVAGTVEAGINLKASDTVAVGASGFGEFSDSTTSYGGRAHVSVKF